MALDVGPLDPPDAPLVSRSETTNVFHLPDGNGALYSYAGPVNWLAPDGRWVPFDTSVIADGLGRFRNRSGPVTVSFAGLSGADPLVRVGTDAWSVGFTAEGMLPTIALGVDGGTARYPGLVGGADLEYTVGRSNLREVITVPNRAAAGSGVFRFPLQLSGVIAHQDADGTIGFYDAAGVRQAWIPPGIAIDSSGDPGAGVQPRSGPVTVNLVDDGVEQAVEVHAPQALLDDPAVVWPIKVDPDVRFPRDTGTGSWDSYVRSNCGTCNQTGTNVEALGGQLDAAQGGYVAKVGWSGGVEYDSYFLYDLSPANNQNILTATWNPYLYLQSQNPSSRYVLWPVADPYDPNTVTFNTRPNHFTSGLCDGNNSKCYGPGPGGVLAHDIRAWVHNWTHSVWNSRGIVVDTGGDATGYWTFLANEDPTNASYIRVVYNLPPTATSLAPNGGYQATTTPQLCGTWTDPNQQFQNDTGYIAFSVYNGGGGLEWSGNSATVANNGRACATTGGLSQGYHTWSAQPYDGREWGATTSATFTVDTVKPGNAAVTSSTHGVESPPGSQWYAGRTVAGSISGPAGDTSGINGYSVSIDQSSATVPAATVNSTGSYSVTATNSNDGQWYVHARAKDNAGWWSDTARYYGVLIDSTPPTAPTVPTSSHGIGVCTSNRTITMNWAPGTDVTSGVLGYSWVFNNDQAARPDNSVEPTGLNTSATYTVPVNADGTYWFHVVTVDKAGNINPPGTGDLVYGPICIDSTADPVTLSPTLLPDMVAQSDQVGLEQFEPYRSFPLGTGTAQVQLRSGNLVARFEDTSIPNQGLNTVISHVYNSQRQSGVLHTNGLGQGWSLSISDLTAGLEGVDGALEDFDLAAPMTTASATVVNGAGTIAGYLLEFTDGDGTTHRFIRKGGVGSRWDSPPGVSLRVREISSGGVVSAYEFIRPDGVIYMAENIKTTLGLSTNTWKITSIRDRRSNTVTFAYSAVVGQARLTSISHNRNGVVATLTWDATTGRLTQITSLPGVSAVDPVTGTNRSYERWVTFTYDGNGQLWKRTENAQAGSDGPRVTEYLYTNGLLTSVKDGKTPAQTTTFAYTGSGYTVQLTSLTDRRQTPQPTPKPWTFAYGIPDPSSGQQDTVVTSPVNDQVTYRTSGRAAIEPTGADRRIAGGNIIAITDAGYGPPTPGQVISEFEWTENRLTKRYQPRLVATPRGGGDPVWSYRYNDVGFLIETTEPAPNDPTRADLPTGAPIASITTKLTYLPVVAGSPDSFRYPPSCVDPAADTKTISEEGYCLAVMELSRTAADALPGTGDTARRYTDLTYNGDGTLASQTQRAKNDGTADGTNDRTTTFTYYTRGGLKTSDGPRSDVADVTTYGDTADATYGGYDRTGQPPTIKDAQNKTTTVTYSPYGPVQKTIDRDGRVTMARYDDRDNPVESVDPSGRHTTAAYDGNDNKTRQTSPRGVATTGVSDDFTTIWTYDNNDWVTQASEPGANPADARRVATTTYADDGQKLNETTPRAGSQVNYTYTPNRTLKTVDAPGQTANAPDRAVTDYSYDPVGRVTQLDRPVTNTAGERPRTTTTYTPSGAVAKQQVIANATQTQVTTYSYNAHGEVLRTDGPRTTPVTAQTSSVYDAFGEVTKTSRRIDTSRTIDSTVGYDRAGNQIQVIQPSATTAASDDLESLYSYDPLNRLSAQTKDPANPTHTVAYSYDGEGNQTERLDKASNVTVRRVSTVYNPDGTVQSEVDKDEAAGTTLAACNYPAGAGDLTTGYDADSQPLVSRSVSGTNGCAGTTTLETQTFSYAAANNWMTGSTQTLRSPENGTNYSRTEAYSYDPDGARASVTHDGLATSYGRSPAGWATTITDWRSRASTMAYFPSGATKTAQLNNATVTGTSDYQRDGAPTSLTWQAGATVLRSHTAIGYDLGGQRTAETIAVRQPGATGTTTGTASFAYDAMDRLTSWVAPFAETDGSQNTTYTLDDGGNITEEQANTGTTAGSGAIRTDMLNTYTTGRLTQRTTNIYNSLGVLTGTVCNTLQYDALGEETRRYTDQPLLGCGGAASGTWVDTTYDPAGHTATADDSRVGAEITDPHVRYTYDAIGRTIASTNPNRSGSAKTTLYFSQAGGDTLAEETDGTGQTMIRYLDDDNGAAIAQESYRTSTGSRTATSTWNWLLHDTADNVATTCDDSGAVLQQAAYDPYGQPKTGGAGKTTNTTYGGSSLGHQAALTVRDANGNTRAEILGDRQYDPGIRRFTTPDTYAAATADLALGTDTLTGNRYLFAASNPVGFFEDGHSSGCRPGYRRVKGPFGIPACAPNGPRGPINIDRIANHFLVHWSGGTVRTCGTSGSGRTVVCVEDVRRLPSADSGSDAVTYGHYIFCYGSCNLRYAHEIVHVGQWERYGDYFGIRYLREARKHGTKCRNKYEREAYTAPGGGPCPYETHEPPHENTEPDPRINRGYGRASI
ncbi:MAG: hypothetical protein LC750_09050 [Actinobacteria bacterium]|nr:hypothetical protein [Actinomycetota bacterium]